MKIQSFVVMAVVCAGSFALWACGDSSTTGATPEVVATPTPAPTPVANQPSHTPAPPPCPTCEAPVTNTNPPVRLTIRVYKIQDLNGTVIEGIPPSVPLGYTVTIDATPKDSNNRDTLGSGTVNFTFSDLNLVKVTSNHGFQKKLKVLAAGDLEIQASLDGIDSNVLTVTLGD